MRLWLIALAGMANLAWGQAMPSPNKAVNRSLPADDDFSKDTEYQRKYREIIQSEENARAALRDAKGGVLPPPAVKVGEPLEGPPNMAPEASLPDRQRLTLPKIVAKPHSPPKPPELGPATKTLSFVVSKEASLDETMTVLPAGSFVKAKVVSGVEANTLEPYPVLLQLEYAFTGPNKTKVDLSNCFMIAKARANLSTERVIMETDTLSCVRENGEHFKAQAKGYTAGSDSTFGSTGTFISKQGTVLLAAVLASIAKNAGEAVALAQQSTTVATGAAGAAQTATNVTGDQAKFIAGRSVVDGASMIAQWYLDYAKQLVPSIGIGSGESVHVIMLETIKVPTLAD